VPAKGKGKGSRGACIRRHQFHTRLPVELPGRYFVIMYDPRRKAYTLVADDVQGAEPPSSYDLGGDMDRILMQFRIWGHYAIGCEALDRAREFRVSQAIFADGRVRAILPKPKQLIVNPHDERKQRHAIPI
jgi:hypothetical protein